MTDAMMFGVILAATLVLSLTPGPAVLYIAARGVEKPLALVIATAIFCPGKD